MHMTSIADLMNMVEQLTKENNALKATQAAPYQLRCKTAEQEVERLSDIVRRQNEEIERLQKVVADQAQTINDLEKQLHSAIEQGKRDTDLLKWFEGRESRVAAMHANLPGAQQVFEMWMREHPKPHDPDALDKHLASTK